jgi:hypothetical protein
LRQDGVDSWLKRRRNVATLGFGSRRRTAIAGQAAQSDRGEGENMTIAMVLDGFSMVEWVGIDGNMVVLLMVLHAVASS